ncbi:MAG: Gfo/Idh/MocA family oxidoreductase [Firmicutes bacterium]|nr:Gfo/Idh/MocA family oxidoreductase [Bacillota bacterium]
MVGDRLGLGILGCGLIARIHLEALRGVAQFRPVGVYDIVPSLAEGLAGAHGLKCYRAFEELLADPEVDVVDICLPSGLHAEYGIQAARAGKHVIVEKPIDVTMEAARSLISAGKEAGVFLAVILQNRFAPSVRRVKEALAAGLLGRLYAGEATIKWYRDEKYFSLSKWKGTKRYDGGGALMNQGIHTIDLLLWFLGPVKRLTSLVRTVRHPIEVEDLAVALLEFENGAIGTITGSTAMKPGFPERIELFGEKGAVVLEAGRIVRWKVDGSEESAFLDEAPLASGSSDPAGIPVTNHRAQFAAIGEALLQRRQPPVSGEESLRALGVILAIYAADGKWIEVGGKG